MTKTGSGWSEGAATAAKPAGCRTPEGGPKARKSPTEAAAAAPVGAAEARPTDWQHWKAGRRCPSTDAPCAMTATIANTAIVTHNHGVSRAPAPNTLMTLTTVKEVIQSFAGDSFVSPRSRSGMGTRTPY